MAGAGAVVVGAEPYCAAEGAPARLPLDGREGGCRWPAGPQGCGLRAVCECGGPAVGGVGELGSAFGFGLERVGFLSLRVAGVGFLERVGKQVVLR